MSPAPVPNPPSSHPVLGAVPVPSAAPARTRILVVEDDATTYRALRVLLEHYQCEVTLARTVREALALLDTLPDVLLLDLMLPDGDGEQVLARSLQRQLKTRAFVVTGVSDPQRLARVQALRPEVVMTKPIDFQRILRHLNRAS